MFKKVKIADFQTLEEVQAEWLKDSKLKAAYDKLDDEFRLLEMMLIARKELNLTQAQLAKRAGMQQEAIARIENGGNPSYKTLARIAKALNKKIAFV